MHLLLLLLLNLIFFNFIYLALFNNGIIRFSGCINLASMLQVTVYVILVHYNLQVFALTVETVGYLDGSIPFIFSFKHDV